MHKMENVKFIIAKLAKQIYHFKNIKERLHKTNASVWYNKTCRQLQLTRIYISIKVKGKFRMNSRPVKTKSGMLLTTQEEQMERWEEHFSEILNKDDDKAGIKQEMRNVKENNSRNENGTEVNFDPPTKTEIRLALTQLKNGKAVGLDNTNTEVLKIDPAIAVEVLYPLTYLLHGAESFLRS